jgi:hypothetical protein
VKDKIVGKSVGLTEAMGASFAEALRPPEPGADASALLWTDLEGEWRPVIPRLRISLPQLYTLGPYDPATRTGPAIWLKCVVDRSIPEVAPPAGIVPILYLPMVSRQELRAAGDCRAEFQPLIELQYRGRVWHQPNGRDWSVEAFLTSDSGLGLDIARDTRTREAMLRSVSWLAETGIDGLRGRRLDADDFDKLAVSDPIRDLLLWMSNPGVFRASHEGARWQAFCNVCRSELNFNPDNEDSSEAAARLAIGGGRWDDIWQRFCEAPRLYPGISSLLRGPALGQGKLAFDPSRRPIANDDDEARLRRELEAAAKLPHKDACERIAALETEHGRRRAWVWAQLGESPFAVALDPLARLASLAKSPLGGASIESLADSYASSGWLCDKAAMQTLASTKSAAESSIISQVVKAVYAPWLDASARQFQEVVGRANGGLGSAVRGVDGERETCLLFADGLRFDLGGLLLEKLEARGLRVRLTSRIAPLPTVTPTAKPVATPLHKDIVGTTTPNDFMPIFSESKQEVNAPRLREQMARRDVEVLDSDELRIPVSSEGGGWTEIGRLDELGHKLGVGLASYLESEVEKIADRVFALLDSGWARVRVVTDHGWLLLPGGLPKFELSSYLLQTKWSRCAVVRGESTPAVPTYPWYWNAQVRIASPPGIACFTTGVEYTHGGLSLQECVVPELLAERGAPMISATISKVLWRGMRCRVAVRTNNPSVRVDLRLNWRQPETSIVASVKEVGNEGEASLVVEQDRYEGASAMVVAIDPSGNVLDRSLTTVGESS